jgi:hypothetical protein
MSALELRDALAAYEAAPSEESWQRCLDAFADAYRAGWRPSAPSQAEAQLARIRAALHELVPPDGSIGDANDLARLRYALEEAERRGYERGAYLVVPAQEDTP